MIDDYAKAQAVATTPVFNRAVERDPRVEGRRTITLARPLSRST